MNSYIKYIFTLAVFTLLMAAASCSNEDFDTYGDKTASSKVRISAYCNEMLENYIDPSGIGTRASDPKSEQETKINTLHIFLFDKDGNFLQGDYNNSLPYIKVNNSFWEMSLDKLNGLDNVRIVALANIDGTENESDNCFDVLLPGGKHLSGGIEDGTRDTGKPYTISNLQDLLEWTYAPRIRMDDENSDISHLPSAGMPMYYMEPIYHDLTKQSGKLEILMTAMMARVDISVKLEPKVTSTDGRLPSMEITSYGVRNMPTTIKPFKQLEGASEEDCTDSPIYVDENGSTEIEVKPIGVTKINKDTNEPVRFSYYTYENVRLPNYDAKHSDGTPFYSGGKFVYPNGVLDTDSVRQRWKSKLARTDEASALILKANYITDQNLTYKAQFTVYMGANPVDDFTVKRNHQYTNNIVIKGLDYIRNSDDNAWTFDGRVNVVDDNPLYLAIINERKVDAHAMALPMDVWLMYREEGDGSSEAVYDHTSKVKVTIPDDCDWIRMVMVPRKVMEDANFEPGTGIEPYFTTDLFERIDNRSILSDKSGWDCGKEVEIVSTKDVNNSRSRIYFYIDENVPTSNEPTDYGNRLAAIKIVYDTDKDGGDHRERTIEIEQKALVKVSPTNRKEDNGEVKWMEYYEEFLEHSDPLDKHLAPGEYYTDGLPWGLSGKSCADYTSVSVYENYVQGYQMTVDIVKNSNTDGLNTVKLYNSKAPQSAFHYCYGKNKRIDSGGNTALSIKNGNTVGWYMPGITELESALTEHYLSFKEFQNNFYWSASAAKVSSGFLGLGTSEESTRARATKVISTSPSVKYAESGSRDGTDNYTNNNGTTGRALRSTSLRIRAFYKVE